MLDGYPLQAKADILDGQLRLANADLAPAQGEYLVASARALPLEMQEAHQGIHCCASNRPRVDARTTTDDVSSRSATPHDSTRSAAGDECVAHDGRRRTPHEPLDRQRHSLDWFGSGCRARVVARASARVGTEPPSATRRSPCRLGRGRTEPTRGRGRARAVSRRGRRDFDDPRRRHDRVGCDERGMPRPRKGVRRRARTRSGRDRRESGPRSRKANPVRFTRRAQVASVRFDSSRRSTRGAGQYLFFFCSAAAPVESTR